MDAFLGDEARRGIRGAAARRLRQHEHNGFGATIETPGPAADVLREPTVLNLARENGKQAPFSQFTNELPTPNIEHPTPKDDQLNSIGT